MLLDFDIIDQIFCFTRYKALLVIGIFLQICSCIIPWMSEKIIQSSARHIAQSEVQNEVQSNTRGKVQNESIALMMNKGIVRCSLLFLGVFFVSLVAFLESDYVLFVAQFLLFALLYPRKG